MGKYILKRVIHGLFSVIVVTGIVMMLIYTMMNREQIFTNDSQFNKVAANKKVIYKYERWEEFGYLDYIHYNEWLAQITDEGQIDEATRSKAVNLGKNAEADSEVVAEYVKQFTDYYESQGYQVIRLNTVMAGRKVATGGQPQLFATKDKPLSNRLLNYFGRFFTVDNVHAVEDIEGERGLTFTLHDPLYGGEKFAPAIIGNGTYHKYLLYCDNRFPYLHQNLISLNLGVSFSINRGVEVSNTMTKPQGSYVLEDTVFPTGLEEQSADDLHTATYQAGSRASSLVNSDRFTDDYTNVQLRRSSMSRMGFSFVIGIIATLLSYVVGIPMAIWMAQKKDKLVDQIGSAYIVFITAMPSLAYIFLVKAIGGKLGMPTTFDIEQLTGIMFVLPIISLALRPIGSTMRWLRRYMIDQMNSDYVKFARSAGLSEREIFVKHIFKNASIPIIHGIPSAILFSLVGALITERVYVVPGIGGLLINSINAFDNGVIVGVALFYAVLSVVSVILGDVLMSIVDPRISFTSKAR